MLKIQVVRFDETLSTEICVLIKLSNSYEMFHPSLNSFARGKLASDMFYLSLLKKRPHVALTLLEAMQSEADTVPLLD